MIEINRLQDTSFSQATETLRLKQGGERCIYYHEETCSAPRIKYRVCQTCPRICLKSTVKNLFERIKELSRKFLGREPEILEEPPPEEPLLGR